MLKEQIKTVKEFNEYILKKKGSEFIAKVYPVESEQMALIELQNIRKKYFDASHHCFAYSVKSDLSKYSDDGEPKGTAGIRILNAMEHFDITDVLIVVVRYFGGTKLGIAPLGKAYYNSSLGALNSLNIIELSLMQQIEISTDFSNINHFHRLINKYSATIVSSDFGDKAVFNCLIKPSLIDKITVELTNVTNGQIMIELKNEFEYR
jgi:uncharacterized YigZ family protein